MYTHALEEKIRTRSARYLSRSSSSSPSSEEKVERRTEVGSCIICTARGGRDVGEIAGQEGRIIQFAN